MIRTIQWTDAGVEMIDQRLLPTEVVYRTYQTVDEVAEAIKTMVVRGAPALGIAAAMGVALGVRNLKSSDDLDAQFKKMCQTIAATRPTARNLFWGIERMGEVFKQYRNAPLAELQRAMKEEAIKVYHEDLETNRRMGMVGQEFLRDKTTVLTHCNAGALCAAGDWGTALGVIRAAISQGKQIHVFADETRPFLQGARLTAWELTEDGIPCTLITDNMAGFFMKAGRIQAVVVGADRIAKNGDTANKVGTYSVAVLAKEHGIPFYVAAPLSTIDLSIETGDEIPIEQRSPDEVSTIGGRRMAPMSVEIENPAFDVTPHRLITAIFTDAGVAQQPYTSTIPALFEKKEQPVQEANEGHE